MNGAAGVSLSTRGLVVGAGDGQASELTDACSTVPTCTNKERLVDLLHQDPREMMMYRADDVPRMLGKEVVFKLSAP